MAMGLATTDDDAACLTATEKQKKQSRKGDLINKVQDICKERGENVADYCKQAGVKSLSDMYVGQLEDLINFLEG